MLEISRSEFFGLMSFIIHQKLVVGQDMTPYKGRIENLLAIKPTIVHRRDKNGNELNIVIPKQRGIGHYDMSIHILADVDLNKYFYWDISPSSELLEKLLIPPLMDAFVVGTDSRIVSTRQRLEVRKFPDLKWRERSGLRTKVRTWLSGIGDYETVLDLLDFSLKKSKGPKVQKTYPYEGKITEYIPDYYEKPRPRSDYELINLAVACPWQPGHTVDKKVKDLNKYNREPTREEIQKEKRLRAVDRKKWTSFWKSAEARNYNMWLNRINKLELSSVKDDPYGPADDGMLWPVFVSAGSEWIMKSHKDYGFDFWETETHEQWSARFDLLKLK